jgi:ribosomal protein S12 methylthiotransferase
MKDTQTVHMVSLGCPKNRVDSEVMLGHMLGAGYTPVDDPQGADVVVVNTCGFIDAAKEESIDVIIEMEDLKKAGDCGKLVVTGCLSQRYAPELAKEMPEVDHFLGTGNFEEIARVLEGRIERPRDSTGSTLLPIVQEHPRLKGSNKLEPFRFSEEVDDRSIYIPDPAFHISSESPRISTQPHYTRYLKVSEGCSNTCSFCIIPKLRGPQRSRTIDDIVREAHALRGSGTVEFNLVAQDLCAFGQDRKPRENLAGLFRALNEVGRQTEGPMWIRAMYAYPRGLTSEVMEVMADSEHILPYLDMPLQHISDSMLQRMRRGKGGESTLELLRKLRATIPGLTLRTTFITGLPGESEDDFKELCDVVEEIRFEQMGVFVYSPEAGTPAAEMDGQIPRGVAQARRDRLMEIQQRISAEQQQAMIGKRVEVLVEGVSDETELLLKGRHQGQAPDIDGITYINDGKASPGDLVTIGVEDSMNYDLVGGIV